MGLEDVYATESRFLQHLQIQAANIDTYKNEVAASGPQIDAIKNDAENLEWLIETCNQIDESKMTVFGAKRTFLGNKTEPPIGSIGAAPALSPPKPLTAGAIKLCRERDQYFLKQPTLTEAARNGMDLVGPQEEAPDPSAVKPTLECATAQAGNFDFSAVIGNRGESDQCELTACEVGSANYQSLIVFTGKAVTGHWPNGTNAPVQIQVRAQLKQKNQNYGVPSDPFIVTVIP